MKKLIKVLKVVALSVVAIVILFAIAITAFVNMSAQFGDSPTAEQEQTFRTASNYKDGKFQNLIPTKMGLSFRQTVSVMGEFIFGDAPGKTPVAPLPVHRIDSAMLSAAGSGLTKVVWFGHSAIYLEADGRKILIDPMLGQHAGPLPLISPKRYNRDLPLEVEKFPFIDAVIISHDHYDHLDYGSIQKLKDKVRMFYVPLGVGAHLRSWGVRAEMIRELDWWDEVQEGGLTFICAPARHFSGRGFTNNTTLWCSWVIRTSREQIYFSGDSGYGPHFKTIGEKYGDMDLVMMECGQYNELWKAIHMMPEETVQATLDVKGKLLLPIHWGAFTLAMHPWTDPVSRVTAEAHRLNVPIATPVIGELISLGQSRLPDKRWWETSQ